MSGKRASLFWYSQPIHDLDVPYYSFQAVPAMTPCFTSNPGHWQCTPQADPAGTHTEPFSEFGAAGNQWLMVPDLIDLD
jgi:hypothetical protein